MRITPGVSLMMDVRRSWMSLRTVTWPVASDIAPSDDRAVSGSSHRLRRDDPPGLVYSWDMTSSIGGATHIRPHPLDPEDASRPDNLGKRFPGAAPAR